MSQDRIDLAVVGAGAAGLFAAIVAARARPGLRVVCFEGARSVGAKILVSGGSRCNVTNTEVTERDFWGGPSRMVKAVLRALPASRTVELFHDMGVALHEESDGKLFPDTNRARTVLDALLRECARLGVEIRTGARVTGVREAGMRLDGGAFVVTAGDVEVDTLAVLIATGGQSLPKSGSDGFGYQLVRRLGHSVVPTTPALVPLLLADSRFAAVSGVSHLAAITVHDGANRHVVSGSLLWTHTGISGPVGLDASRHWHRAVQEGRVPEVTVSLLPGTTFEALEARLLDAAASRPTSTLAREVGALLPASVADVLTRQAHVEPATPLAHLTKEARRAVIRAALTLPLRVTGSRGYQYAEATAGGVPLEEIDPATMESRVCPGLYLAGEILDVDGRLGGFNFQWAWSSGWVAGTAVAGAAVAGRAVAGRAVARRAGGGAGLVPVSE